MYQATDEVHRYLYETCIAIDANFRLKRRAISNEDRDAALGSGWGYFVQDKQYRRYILENTEQAEVCLRNDQS